MVEYFIRRLLLTIPTFIGCTFVVFQIVQFAPGGPLEQQIMALKRGGQGGSESAASGNEMATGQNLPEAALDELRRFYGFDKPWWERYFIWLGLMEREAESFNVAPDEPRLVGEGIQLMLKKEGSGFKIVQAESQTTVAEDWQWEKKTYPDGKIIYRIYREEYSGVLTGNFGKSYTYRKPVLELVADRLPISIQFGIIGFILSYTICVYLGIQKALHHNSKFDFISSSLVFIGYSIPGWALGAVVLVLFATQDFMPILPLGEFQSPDYDTLGFFEKFIDRAEHFILPTIAYTIGSFASLTMLMKNSLLDTLNQDYVRTAFAKGLKERRVIWLHAMRNSIIPISANIGYIIGIFLASNYLIETVFNIEGLGKLTFEAVIARDYPIVFSYTVITVGITLVGSILSDLAISIVDPRIRFR